MSIFLMRKCSLNASSPEQCRCSQWRTDIFKELFNGSANKPNKTNPFS